MIVRPIELVNICSIFPSLKVKEINQNEFKKLVQVTRLIDSDALVDTIIEESINAGLVSRKDDKYFLTRNGQHLCRYHREPNFQINSAAKKSFIVKVLFNTDLKEWCCGEFINRFQVDTSLNTFVYYRTPDMSLDDSKWLIILSSIGLIDVNVEQAIIRHEYLGLINDLLVKIRDPLNSEDIQLDNERNEVGKIAEEIALSHEKTRLTDAGFPYLSPLIQQISIVDKSAGFDILSFAGQGKNPDSNIFIEVKGTRNDEFTFIWSRNERKVATKEKSRYWIYGYTNVDINNKSASGLIKIRNPLSRLPKLGYTSIPLSVYVSKGT